jgi:hypothetical protein
MTRPR